MQRLRATTLLLASLLPAAAAQDVYVANQLGDSVTVWTEADPTDAITLPVGDQPHEIAIDPLGRFVYVTNRLDGDVSVLDGASRSEVDTDGDPTNGLTRIPAGVLPHGVAVSPGGTHVWVTNNGSDDVSVIATATWQASATLPTAGGFPHMVRFTPDGQEAWVVNLAGGTVQVIDPVAALQGPGPGVVATIPVGIAPEGVAFTPDGLLALVANGGSNTVSVIDRGTLAVTALPVGTRPLRVEVAPDGLTAYVANFTSQDVTVLDLATLSVSGTITGVPNPVGMAFSTDGERLLVASFTGVVAVVERATGSIAGFVQAGAGSDGIVLQPPLLAAAVPPAPGGTAVVAARRPQDAGLPYQAACSFATAPGIPLGDGRSIPLQPDVLFFLSLTDPTTFVGFSGLLDANGYADLRIVLPPVPGLSGVGFFLSAATLDPGASAGIRTVMPPLQLTVQ